MLPDDQFLLAQLYDSAGQWPKAREQFRSLSSGPAANRLYLAQYARGLVQHRELEEAQRCIDRLEHLENDRHLAARTMGLVELKALLLEARGQDKEAHALFQGLAENKSAPPENALLLIGHLVRRRHFAEALDQCEAAWQRCSPEMVGGVTVAVSSNGEAPALAGLLREALEEVLPEDLERWLAEARVQRKKWRAEGVPMPQRRPLLLPALNRLYAAVRDDSAS